MWKEKTQAEVKSKVCCTATERNDAKYIFQNLFSVFQINNEQQTAILRNCVI